MEASEGICVGIRMRPLNERELASGQQMLFQCMASANAVAQMRDGAPVEGQVYYFDKVFDEKSSTVDVYSHIGKNIVQGVMNGINGTIFACMYLFMILYLIHSYLSSYLMLFSIL